jgi:hypothetical protein
VENINYEFPNKKRKSGNPEFDEYTIWKLTSPFKNDVIRSRILKYLVMKK